MVIHFNGVYFPIISTERPAWYNMEQYAIGLRDEYGNMALRVRERVIVLVGFDTGVPGRIGSQGR